MTYYGTLNIVVWLVQNRNKNVGIEIRMHVNWSISAIDPWETQ